MVHLRTHCANPVDAPYKVGVANGCSSSFNGPHRLTVKGGGRREEGGGRKEEGGGRKEEGEEGGGRREEGGGRRRGGGRKEEGEVRRKEGRGEDKYV